MQYSYYRAHHDFRGPEVIIEYEQAPTGEVYRHGICVSAYLVHVKFMEKSLFYSEAVVLTPSLNEQSRRFEKLNG